MGNEHSNSGFDRGIYPRPRPNNDCLPWDRDQNGRCPVKKENYYHPPFGFQR